MEETNRKNILRGAAQTVVVKEDGTVLINSNSGSITIKNGVKTQEVDIYKPIPFQIHPIGVGNLINLLTRDTNIESDDEYISRREREIKDTQARLDEKADSLNREIARHRELNQIYIDTTRKTKLCLYLCIVGTIIFNLAFMIWGALRLP
ncbi:MAG: hypothetical protein R3Y68_09010 [Rikenellaceae bacterium]